jgi:predicted RNase H-like nuclease
VIALERHATAAALISQQPLPVVIAIDIPVGLTDAGRRLCDDEARRLLGWPRRNSVFPPPVRPALNASSRAQASRITRRVDGRGVGAQAWAIFHKIGEVDALLSADVRLQDRVHEVHPELCFWAWNAGRPMSHRKTTPQGQAERRRLIDAHFGSKAVAEVRGRYLVKDVGHDDIQDAFAALWTAERIVAGTAVVIPASPPSDAAGLRMEMWY